MVPSARGRYTRVGTKKSKNAESVKYINRYSLTLDDLKSHDQEEKPMIGAEILVKKSVSNQIDSETKEDKQ